MIIIFVIQLSIAGNIFLLFQYILKGDKKYRKWFVLFTLANIYFVIMAMGLYIFLPSLFEDADSTITLWIFSGIMMALTLSAKIQILKSITKRIREQKKAAGTIKDMTSVQDEEKKALEAKLQADRQMLYRQIPYRHLRVQELKRQQEEERRRAENQKPKGILELATSKEMFVFMGTMPFFLLCSAYFLAKIINYAIYGEF